ncbi:SOS response-associated peptidase [Corynebacterium tapiri]|uniref:Abasic site processing protein n=1 Tax=Corynebacterium tapiri TaxID=1448266 RepID=A0A5C4U5I8_9CORY|nr:SOS response-associated peptidase [Corynebacterium tapiri]TNL98408.1 SOS response-associated peptidase [Corynebacterium tapiri]
MCGRFVMFTVGEALLERIGQLPGVTQVHAPDNTPSERYNIAPTTPVGLVRLDGEQALLNPARWALLPRWKKDDKGPPLFNARAETVQEKPSFRQAFADSRGVIPLDGYYEWHVNEEGYKQPYYVHLPEGEMLFAAALWSTGLDMLSCTMITTQAAEPMDWLHHRLPRFLLPEEIRQWCEGTPEEAAQLLTPAPAQLRERLQWQPAAKEVGNVRNDHPGLLGEVE